MAKPRWLGLSPAAQKWWKPRQKKLEKKEQIIGKSRLKQTKMQCLYPGLRGRELRGVNQRRTPLQTQRSASPQTLRFLRSECLEQGFLNETKARDARTRAVKQVDLALVQEAHSDRVNEVDWQKEQEGRLVLSHGSPSSAERTAWDIMEQQELSAGLTQPRLHPNQTPTQKTLINQTRPHPKVTPQPYHAPAKGQSSAKPCPTQR
ncbi:uncharacterized protein LOC119262600 [Pygocentrus nattereri]|uniref:uncharacterized protein LOC119262600 n=1 Tax=Pygocentrus nattereri TaxID=42514 RepID=UPI001890DF55|nr:uncharacterized protein LOC119262600 [Pygocentrus nattereri]